MASSVKGTLALLRRMADALPETSETTTFGHPTFRAGKKTFVVLERYGGEDVVCVKATLEDQALLILDPRFFIAPYIGQHGWTAVRLAEGIEERELEELVGESYRLVATKRMLAELEGELARKKRPSRTKKK